MILIVRIILAVLILLGILAWIIWWQMEKTGFPGNLTEKECSVDSDCVPASCCHSTACVSKEKAPNCSEIFCSQVCVPETLDCGQGSCACINNKCEVSGK